MKYHTSEYLRVYYCYETGIWQEKIAEDVLFVCQDCEMETFESQLCEPYEGYGTLCACGSDNLKQKENYDE